MMKEKVKQMEEVRIQNSSFISSNYSSVGCCFNNNNNCGKFFNRQISGLISQTRQAL